MKQNNQNTLYNQALNEVLEVVKTNDIIDKLYKKLTELEINGLKESDEYKMIVNLISDVDKKNEPFIKKASYFNEELNHVLDNIQSLNDFSDDYIDYVEESDNTKLKRLFCHFAQNALIKFDFPEDMLMQGKEFVRLNGIPISLDNALDIIEDLDEDSADHIKGIIEELKDQTYEVYSTYNYLLYCRNGLQYHTTADYLEEAIRQERNKKIKNKLIGYKYKLISIQKYLETPFLKNPYDYSRTDYYQELLNEYYEDNIEFFLDWDSYYKEQVNHVISNIMERNNEKYTNIKDRYYDKLLSIYLKVFSSISSCEETLDVISKDKKTAIELSNNNLNKNVIKNSLKLDQNLLLSKKLEKSKKM